MSVFRISAAVLSLGLFVSSPAQALNLNPISAVKGAIEAAIEDRSSEDITKDLELMAKITANVIDKMGADVISINSDVYEQKVMLTGAVDKLALKVQAEKLTRAVKGVKTIYNEILITKPLNQKKGAAESFVDDTVIESKINALLLDGKGVNVTNLRWRSVGGHVFLFGRALSNAEHKKSVNIVKDIKNVLSVKSRIFVRPKG